MIVDSRVILPGTCLKVLSRNTGPAVQEKPVHGSDTNKAHGTDETMDTHTASVNPISAAAPQTTGAEHIAEQKTVPAHAPAPGGAAEHATEVHGVAELETPSFPVVGMAFVVYAIFLAIQYSFFERHPLIKTAIVIVVAIGVNPDKKYTFDLDERMALLSAACGGIEVVVVDSF